jgi:CubicO group peptidase (beta-lactamase class C family)
VRAWWRKPRAVALGAALLAALLVVASVLRNGETPEDVLHALVDRTGVAGGVVAWGAPGRAGRIVAAGLADRGTGRAMTPEDRLPIASLTKPVTAAMVLERVDAGLVTLDTPISELDAGAPPEVTVGQALAHLGGWDRRASGEPYALSLADLSARAGGRPVATCRDIALLPDFAPSLPPGREYVYSNVGYCWLGQMFEEQGGYAAALEAAHGTRFSIDRSTATVLPDALDPALRDWAVMQPGMAGPFGGIVTDAASFLAFALRPIDERTLSPPPVAWETNYYGLGWRVWPRGGTVFLTHYGSMPGVFSFVIRKIDGGAAVLLLNGSVGDPEGLSETLAELLIAMPSWQ